MLASGEMRDYLGGFSAFGSCMKILVKECPRDRTAFPLHLSIHLQKKRLDRLAEAVSYHDFRYTLLNQGGDDGKFSCKTVGTFYVFKFFLKFAQDGFPLSDPSCIKFPKKNVKKRQCLNRETQTAMNNCLDREDVISLGIIFAQIQGQGAADLCSYLRWGDLDLDAGFMQISRTVERIADLNLATPAKDKSDHTGAEDRTFSADNSDPGISHRLFSGPLQAVRGKYISCLEISHPWNRICTMLTLSNVSEKTSS